MSVFFKLTNSHSLQARYSWSVIRDVVALFSDVFIRGCAVVVAVKLPSTSCAIVALDRSGAASGCLVVKSPSASTGCFRGMDVLADSVGGLFVCFALPVSMLASALCERFPVFSFIKLHGVMAVAVATLCMGCAAPVHPDPGPGSCLQLSPPSLTVAAAAAARVLLLGLPYLLSCLPETSGNHSGYRFKQNIEDRKCCSFY